MCLFKIYKVHKFFYFSTFNQGLSEYQKYQGADIYLYFLKHYLMYQNNITTDSFDNLLFFLYYL